MLRTGPVLDSLTFLFCFTWSSIRLQIQAKEQSSVNKMDTDVNLPLQILNHGVVLQIVFVKDFLQVCDVLWRHLDIDGPTSGMGLSPEIQLKQTQSRVVVHEGSCLIISL
jgi:hypothetical protein